MIPSEERGRFFGLLGLFVGGLQPISMSLSGIIAEYIRIPIIFTFCTIVILLMSWRVISLKELRNLFAIEAQKREEKVLVSNS